MGRNPRLMQPSKTPRKDGRTDGRMLLRRCDFFIYYNHRMNIFFFFFITNLWSLINLSRQLTFKPASKLFLSDDRSHA